MLKYTGDFKKLKDYGFIITNKGKRTYLDFEGVYEHNKNDICNPYLIIIHDRSVFIRVNQQYNKTREYYEYEDLVPYVLYDLIKDGLVIKEESK
jgi:hypothetical protein